jgi:AraC family transcriptional activator of mtrCDE
VLLDRLMDNAGLDVSPVAVCDVRAGVRVELPALPEPHVHCIVRGHGELRTAMGLALPIAPGSVAIVPAHTVHSLEPCGGAARVLKVGAAVSSDHVPAVTAGSGEAGLTFVCGRIQSTRCESLGLFDRLLAPVVVDLSDVPGILPLLETLLDEQASRAPGNRRMTALLMQQCLMHLLRKQCREGDAALPWLAVVRDRGLSRALDGMLRAPWAAHSAKSLAAIAGVSRSSFSHRFAQAFGQSPIDWLNRIRVHEAMRLLRTTDLSLDAVAARVGLTGSSPVFRQLRVATSGTAWERGEAGPLTATEVRRRAPRAYAGSRTRGAVAKS